jgi:hypothetical protein
MARDDLRSSREMEFWGGIPGVIVNEMEILTGETSRSYDSIKN